MMNLLHTLCLFHDEFFLKASMRAHLKVVQYGGCSGWCCNNTRTKARAVKTCKKWFCRLITYHWNYNYIPYLLFTFVKSSYNTTTITICIVVFLISRKKQSIGATTIENTSSNCPSRNNQNLFISLCFYSFNSYTNIMFQVKLKPKILIFKAF